MKNSANKTPTNRGRKPKCKTSCVINPAATMRARSATIKKFGKVCAPIISPWRKRELAEFLREHREKQSGGCKSFIGENDVR